MQLQWEIIFGCKNRYSLAVRSFEGLMGQQMSALLCEKDIIDNFLGINIEALKRLLLSGTVELIG